MFPLALRSFCTFFWGQLSDVNPERIMANDKCVHKGLFTFIFSLFPSG